MWLKLPACPQCLRPVCGVIMKQKKQQWEAHTWISTFGFSADNIHMLSSWMGCSTAVSMVCRNFQFHSSKCALVGKTAVLAVKYLHLSHGLYKVLFSWVWYWFSVFIFLPVIGVFFPNTEGNCKKKYVSAEEQSLTKSRLRWQKVQCGSCMTRC